MPYYYRDNPNMVVLNGELDFDKTESPRKIYERLRRIAEDVGAFVTTCGLNHGGCIKVYPAWDPEYYVLNLYEVNEDPNSLKVMFVETWRKVAVLDLTKEVEVKQNAV